MKKKDKYFTEGDFGGDLYVMDKKQFSRGEALRKGTIFFRNKGSQQELKIYAGFARYCPKVPNDDIDELGDNGYYKLVDTAQKGAFEVWIVEEV